MNVPVDYDNEKEIAKNGSKITGVLKHKTDKKVENQESTGVYSVFHKEKDKVQWTIKAVQKLQECVRVFYK